MGLGLSELPLGESIFLPLKLFLRTTFSLAFSCWVTGYVRPPHLPTGHHEWTSPSFKSRLGELCTLDQSLIILEGTDGV